MKTVQTLALLTFLGAAGSAAAITNGGFESGNLTGFTKGANSMVTVETAPFAGFSAPEGTHFARLSTAGSSEDLSMFGGTNGSFLSTNLVMAAGQQLSFQWAFQTNEANTPVKYDDVALFLNGNAITLTTAFATLPSGTTGWNNYSWVAPTAFFGTVTWVVTNKTDKLFDSNLLIDNVRVASVPEPETYAMLLSGVGLLAAFARRRKA